MEGKLIKRSTGRYDLVYNDEDGEEILMATSSDFKFKNLNSVKNPLTSELIQISKLSIKNCDAIANGYDLDELAFQSSMSDEKEHSDMYRYIAKKFFKLGAEAILEILGDKKFSEGDMLAFGKICTSDAHAPCDKRSKTWSELLNVYVQSLQQTEFDVEIEMEFNPINHASGLEITGNELMDVAILENYKPKLDSDGCLILKRK